MPHTSCMHTHSLFKELLSYIHHQYSRYEHHRLVRSSCLCSLHEQFTVGRIRSSLNMQQRHHTLPRQTPAAHNEMYNPNQDEPITSGHPSLRRCPQAKLLLAPGLLQSGTGLPEAQLPQSYRNSSVEVGETR